MERTSTSTHTLTSRWIGRIAVTAGVAAGVTAICVGIAGAGDSGSVSRRIDPVDTRSIAALADAHGLVGLSPASLRLVEPERTERTERVERVDLSEIAAWADANGLVGLSPASLRPVDAGVDHSAP